MPPKRNTRATRQPAEPEAVGLLRLPTELQSAITGYLTSRKDLQSICSTCKELQAIATPQLYRNVTLRVWQLKPELTHQFDPRNPGLAHIRNLTVCDADGYYNTKVHGPHLTRVLSVLPKNALQAFHLESPRNVGSTVAFLLRLRQRKLTNYTYHFIDIAQMLDFLPDTDELKYVTTIAFRLWSDHDCQNAAGLLWRAKSVTALSVTVDPKGQSNRELAETRCGRYLRLLFNDCLFEEGRHSLALKRAYFKNVDLGSCGAVVTGVVKTELLKGLTLECCRETHLLVDHLRQSGIKLESYTNSFAMEETKCTGSLESFLSSFAGLQRLRLSTSNRSAVHEDCSWAAIRHHSSTLTFLYVDDFRDLVFPFRSKRHDRTLAGFRGLLASCSELEHLAIHAPGPEPRFWGRAEGFGIFLKCLKSSPKLTVLRIFIYPEMLDDGDTDSFSDFGEPSPHYSPTERAMQYRELADKIFKYLFTTCSRLRALVIDARPPYEDREGHKYGEQHSFLRAVQRDVFGHTTAAAVPCSTEQLKTQEQCWELVENDVVLLPGR